MIFQFAKILVGLYCMVAGLTAFQGTAFHIAGVVIFLVALAISMPVLLRKQREFLEGDNWLGWFV